MARPLFQASFPRVKLRVVERKGNPCKNPTLQHHYFAGFKLALIETIAEDTANSKRYFWVKIVRVRPSWNEAIKDASEQPFRDCFITHELDEVILNVSHTSGWSNGVAGDIITFFFHSTIDNFERTHSILIPYRDQMKIQNSSA